MSDNPKREAFLNGLTKKNAEYFHEHIFDEAAKLFGSDTAEFLNALYAALCDLSEEVMARAMALQTLSNRDRTAETIVKNAKEIASMNAGSLGLVEKFKLEHEHDEKVAP